MTLLEVRLHIEQRRTRRVALQCVDKVQSARISSVAIPDV